MYIANVVYRKVCFYTSFFLFIFNYIHSKLSFLKIYTNKIFQKERTVYSVILVQHVTRTEQNVLLMNTIHSLQLFENSYQC